MAIRYYEMRLLDQLGFRPKLFECAVCGKEIQAEDQFFSFLAGGVVCPTSAQERRAAAIRDGRRCTRSRWRRCKYLRHFQRSTTPRRPGRIPTDKVQQETETLMQGFFTYLLERELKTPGFSGRSGGSGGSAPTLPATLSPGLASAAGSRHAELPLPRNRGSGFNPKNHGREKHPTMIFRKAAEH